MGGRCLNSIFANQLKVVYSQLEYDWYCPNIEVFMKKLILFMLPILIVACQSGDAPAIAGFEPYVWKRDKFGCASERVLMADTLVAQREKLLQLTETEIIRLLGQPDARDLYVRNQKFLIYLLEPNKRCTAAESVPVEAQALHIRLNALGKANELYISAF